MKSINVVCTVISIIVSTTWRVVETVVVEPVKLITNSIETMSSLVSSSSSKSRSSHKRYDYQPISSLREIFSDIVRFVSSSTFVYQEEKHERRKRRMAPLCCCLFLLLALLGASSLLGFAGYSYLFASTENETEISPLHDIDKKLELVIGTLEGEEATNTGGEEVGGGVGGGGVVG
ncbi:uncharacterized protein LOC117122355, partial [Anneissia japonica]|uniref:uncharacterized protein LOC117122355 n=1 Tax=Anneissia japonica TaxID=1529436 RepID=UPI00142559AF